jgi:hypothetical protein
VDRRGLGQGDLRREEQHRREPSSAQARIASLALPGAPRSTSDWACSSAHARSARALLFGLARVIASALAKAASARDQIAQLARRLGALAEVEQLVGGAALGLGIAACQRRSASTALVHQDSGAATAPPRARER